MTDDGYGGFGLDNLPYGVILPRGEAPRVGVRFGDSVLDLTTVDCGVEPSVFTQRTLNAFLSLSRAEWDEVRGRVGQLIEGSPLLIPLADVEVVCPIKPPDFVDFYSSLEHATNLGRMFRPTGDPLLPNWRHLPVGYHGRSTSVITSETPVRRPLGQRPPAEEGGQPTFGPSQRLDFELEFGFVTGGPGNRMGEPIAIEDVREHIFGCVLVNDWSARDLQRWEYQPLGPFLSKSFATTISPWVVPIDALEPYRVAGPPQEPEPFEYLRAPEPWGFDIELEVDLNDTTISRTNFRHMYWSMAQQLAHATVNGAVARAGDLYASGTISGPEPGSYGSLIELTWAGRDPLTLTDGTTRTFLADGDTVTLRGRAGSVSFGECRGTILPAPS